METIVKKNSREKRLADERSETLCFAQNDRNTGVSPVSILVPKLLVPKLNLGTRVTRACLGTRVKHDPFVMLNNVKHLAQKRSEILRCAQNDRKTQNDSGRRGEILRFAQNDRDTCGTHSRGAYDACTREN